MSIGFTNITNSTACTCELIKNTWFKKIKNKMFRTEHNANIFDSDKSSIFCAVTKCLRRMGPASIVTSTQEERIFPFFSFPWGWIWCNTDSKSAQKRLPEMLRKIYCTNIWWRRSVNITIKQGWSTFCPTIPAYDMPSADVYRHSNWSTLSHM